MAEATGPAPPAPPPVPHGWRRTHRRWRHSIKARLIALFLVLAVGMTAIFLIGMQRALGTGWSAAARPLVSDYVDRLAEEIGSPPSQQRARRLAERLPLRIRITGPQLNWQSAADDEHEVAYWERRETRAEPGLLVRNTADGHRIEFGVDTRAWRARPRFVGWLTLATLLLLTAAAYAYVRRLLRPLDDIRQGAQRFGRGEFGEPIRTRREDELGDLARDVNAMARGIHGMLEAKRSLLLAISHELRSPITRARLHAELLPEDGEASARREALLRELQLMTELVSDLLEGERLGEGHAVLHREETDIVALVRDALAASRDRIALQLPAEPVRASVDAARLRLLVRNLVDNAVRHTPEGAAPPEVRLHAAGGFVSIVVRDHGTGVPEADLPRLGEPFWRADEARARSTGGVGLGLYLCRLVAQAHGGRLRLRNAQPGLEATATFPAMPLPADAAGGTRQQPSGDPARGR